jgi:hypothetical protein
MLVIPAKAGIHGATATAVEKRHDLSCATVDCGFRRNDVTGKRLQTSVVT